MIQSSEGYIPIPLGDLMRGTFPNNHPGVFGAKSSGREPAKTGEPKPGAQNSEFDAELKQTLATAVGAAPESIQIQETTPATSARNSPTRQFIVTVEAPPSGPFPTLMPGNNFQALEVVPDAKDFNYDPIALTKDRLAKLGVDTSQFQFSRWDDVINNIGGSRTFHYMRVILPNGMISDHSVEWTLQNPNVTAVELQSSLREQRVMS
jgi:hypothetical protein